MTEDRDRTGDGRLIAVVGMVSEAKRLAGAGVTVIIGGGQAASLSEQLERELRAGAAGLISFGLCGSLDPDLIVGDCLIGSAVIDADDRIVADRTWAARLTAAIGSAKPAEVAASDIMIADASAKAALRQTTGARAVDMESHIVARLARHHNIPFAVLRVVSDGAHRALPKAAQAGLRADGKPDLRAVLRSLAGDPRQLRALIRTGREAGVALRALATAGRLAGAHLCCPYLNARLRDVA
jgi:hopanoid-associated phosphorylase